MSQKITIISFDLWNYDSHIDQALRKKGIDSFHIRLANFKHKNIISRIGNSLSKIFLKKNPKYEKRQKHIINCLEKAGDQDQILVINPEMIDIDYHLKIKSRTKKYIAYLYDSVDRCPVKHLLEGVFDEIFSFDNDDCEKYGFKLINNYNYISPQPIATVSPIKNETLYIASFDNRINEVFDLKLFFDKHKITNRLIIVGKKTTLFKLKNFYNAKIKGIEFKTKRITQNKLHKLYKQTNIVIDLVRDNQSGLSFRVFEAMAFNKKIITNNTNITDFDFYNTNNILIIKDKQITYDESFFTTKYKPLPTNIYHKYTIENWIEIVFQL
jgi:hypothetical protein